MLLPSHDIYVYCDRIFFGKSYLKLHQAIDFAVGFGVKILPLQPIFDYEN